MAAMEAVATTGMADTLDLLANVDSSSLPLWLEERRCPLLLVRGRERDLTLAEERCYCCCWCCCCWSLVEQAAALRIAAS